MNLFQCKQMVDFWLPLINNKYNFSSAIQQIKTPDALKVK
nr:MAG TPA_asm: hypothetical protein [Caudoviricetes sp.]